MPKVHMSSIVDDLSTLSAASDSMMQQLVQNQAEEDWFSLIAVIAQNIFNLKNKTELSSANVTVPSILSLLHPETEDENKGNSNLLQENASRAHIHKLKQASVVASENLSTEAEHKEVSKSSADVDKTECIPEESCHQNTDPEASRLHIQQLKQAPVIASENLSTEAEHKEVSKSTVDVNKTECIPEESCHQNTDPEADKVVDHDSEEANRMASINNDKPSVKDAINLQSENNYNQTPKVSKDPLKSCYLTQVLDKRFRSVCQNVSENVQVNDIENPTSNSQKRIKKEATSRSHLRKEVLESNSTAKAVSREHLTRSGSSSVLGPQRSVLTRTRTNNALLASQKNASSVIQPTYLKSMAVKAGVQVMRKEDEKLKELKMKEEKNNEKVKKIKAERQMRLEENKRKRQEKMEQAELKRQKLEKEKQLQLKKFAKPEVSMSTANQTKSADRRKCDDDVEEISETKLSAKTEREDIGKKFENHKTNVDTSSELNVTKVVHKAEDRSNGLTEKHPKHPLGALNETVTVSKSTPPSAPLKSKLIESQLKTPANASPLSSYEMTPIQDSDSDDEKQRDRSKKIPSWAQGCLLRTAVINQNHEGRDPNEIFGSVIESPNLEKIFCRKIPCYKRRTSSQFWESIPD